MPIDNPKQNDIEGNAKKDSSIQVGELSGNSSNQPKSSASNDQPVMNQFPFSQLEKLLTCPVCLERYRQPKLLPCQHTYCLECLENMADYYKRIVKCAECRTENILPYKGVETFPNNLTIMSFLELPSVIATDDSSAAKAAAANQWLLAAAAQQRQQISRDGGTGFDRSESSSSPTVPLSASHAQSQPQQQYRFVKLEVCPICNENSELTKCLHCDRKVCSECKESHMEQLQREVIRLLNNTQRNVPKLEETIVIIEQKLANMKNNFNFVKNEIKMEIERCIRELNNRERVLLDEVDNLMESEIRKMTERQATLSTEKEEIENYCKQVAKKLNVPPIPVNNQGRVSATIVAGTGVKDDTTVPFKAAPGGVTTSSDSSDKEESPEPGNDAGDAEHKSSSSSSSPSTTSASLPSVETSPDKEAGQLSQNVLNDSSNLPALAENVAAITTTTDEQPSPVTDEELLALKTQIASYLDHIREINIEAVESYKRMKFIADNNMLRSNILTFGELHVRSVVHSGTASGTGGLTNNSWSGRRASTNFLRSSSFEKDEIAVDEFDSSTSTVTTPSTYNSTSSGYKPTYGIGGSSRLNYGGGTLTSRNTPSSSSSSRFLSSSTSTRPSSKPSSAYSTDYHLPSSSSSLRRPTSSTYSSGIGSSTAGTNYDDTFTGYLGNDSSVSSGHKNWRSGFRKKLYEDCDTDDKKLLNRNESAEARNIKNWVTTQQPPLPRISSDFTENTSSLSSSRTTRKIDYKTVKSEDHHQDSNKLTRYPIHKDNRNGCDGVNSTGYTGFTCNKTDTNYDESLMLPRTNIYRLEGEQGRKEREAHKSFYLKKYGRSLTNTPLGGIRRDIDNIDDELDPSFAATKFDRRRNLSPLHPVPKTTMNDGLNGVTTTTYINNALSKHLSEQTPDERTSMLSKTCNSSTVPDTLIDGGNDYPSVGSSKRRTPRRNQPYQRSRTESNMEGLGDNGDVKNVNEQPVAMMDEHQIKVGRRGAERESDRWWKSWLIDDGEIKTRAEKRLEKDRQAMTIRRPQSAVPGHHSPTTGSAKDTYCASSSSSVEYLHNPPIKLRMENKRKAENGKDTEDEDGATSLYHVDPADYLGIHKSNANGILIMNQNYKPNSNLCYPELLTEAEKQKIQESLKNKFNTLQRFKRRNELLMSLASGAVFSPDGTSNNENQRYVPIKERIDRIRTASREKSVVKDIITTTSNTSHHPTTLLNQIAIVPDDTTMTTTRSLNHSPKPPLYASQASRISKQKSFKNESPRCLPKKLVMPFARINPDEPSTSDSFEYLDGIEDLDIQNRIEDYNKPEPETILTATITPSSQTSDNYNDDKGLVILEDEIVFENEIRAYIARITKLQRDIDQFNDDVHSCSSLKNYETPDQRLSPPITIGVNLDVNATDDVISKINLRPSPTKELTVYGEMDSSQCNVSYINDSYCPVVSPSNGYLETGDDFNAQYTGGAADTDNGDSDCPCLLTPPNTNTVMETITNIGTTTYEQEERDRRSSLSVPYGPDDINGNVSVNSTHSILVKHESKSKPMYVVSNDDTSFVASTVNYHQTAVSQSEKSSSGKRLQQSAAKSLLCSLKDKFLKSDSCSKNGGAGSRKDIKHLGVGNKNAAVPRTHQSESNGIEAFLNVKVHHPPNNHQSLSKDCSSTKANPLNLKRPTGLALSSDGQILFVADKGAHKIRALKLQISSTKEEKVKIPSRKIVSVSCVLKSYGTFGYTAEKLNRPCDVAVSPNGNGIAIADSGNHKIVCLDRALNFVAMLGTGQRGSTYPGQLDAPSGLAYDGTGEYLYVCDKGNRRVQIYTVSHNGGGACAGTLAAASFSTASSLVCPKRIYFGARRGLVYVTDIGDHSLKIFDARMPGEGKPIAQVNKIPVSSTKNSGGIREKFHYPSSVSSYRYDSDNLALLDAGNRRIIQITPDGRVIQIIPLISAAPVLDEGGSLAHSTESVYASSSNDDIVDLYHPHSIGSNQTSDQSSAGSGVSLRRQPLFRRQSPKFDTCVSLSLLDDYSSISSLPCSRDAATANSSSTNSDNFQMFALTDTANSEITFI